MCIHYTGILKGVFLIIYSAKTRFSALALSFLLLILPVSSSFASTLGPASSYEELSTLAANAADGDTILVSGEILAASEPALSTHSSIRIQSENGAVIRGLRLQDASVSLSGIALDDSLSISGTSHVHLSSIRITGAPGNSAISFHGNGTLIIEPGCQIVGGQEASGVSIAHDGGEFYGSIEGSVRGGSGTSGGNGVVISPLLSNGAVMITGNIQGGNGNTTGGNALNLYDLSGNAYITIDGNLQGGSGSIGGDGIQLVSASDNVAVRIGGQISGGSGENHGGNAMILLNAEDASAFRLSGHFSGGDAISEHARPGTSLQLVGKSAAARAHVDNCILEDGKPFIPTPAPIAEPTSEPTTEPTPEPTIEPTTEPTPEPTTEPTPEPTIEPTTEPTPEPTIDPTAEPTPEPTIEPTTTPVPDPTAEPPLEPSIEPTAAPTDEPLETVNSISTSSPTAAPNEI